MLSELICITYGSAVCCKEILNFLFGTIPFSIKSPFFAMKSQSKIKHIVSTSGQVLGIISTSPHPRPWYENRSAENSDNKKNV